MTGRAGKESPGDHHGPEDGSNPRRADEEVVAEQESGQSAEGAATFVEPGSSNHPHGESAT